MYAPQSLNDLVFLMFYGGVTMLALLSAIYMALRRNNAFARKVTPPSALRRWSAAFFLMAALSHVWWYVLGVYWLTDDRLVRNITAVTLDHVILVPLVMAVLLRLLQDRRRLLWPWVLTQLPIVSSAALGIARHDEFYGFQLPTYCQMAVMFLFFVYYVRAVMQYGRWLRDNYADLEHKEVWQSLLFIVALFVIYEAYFTNPGVMSREYLAQVNTIVIVGFLLWRVENLQRLDDSEECDHSIDEEPVEDELIEDDEFIADDELAVADEPAADDKAATESTFLNLTIPANIGYLLHKYCVTPKLYLQHGLTLTELSERIGTNRTYLSSYLAQQGVSYNSYINRLRIDYFEHVFLKALATDRPFTAKQLAHRCGFSSYSTFATAFKQFKGQSVTTWIKEHTPPVEEVELFSNK